jgi:putative ABC transporter-associated repeat protein
MWTRRNVSRTGRKRIAAAVWTVLASGVALVVGVIVGGPPAQAQDAEGEASEVVEDEPFGTGQVVIDEGHIDIGPRFVDGAWTLMVRDDTVEPSEWRELSDVVLRASDAAIVEVPDDPDFAFLGEPGNDVWLLPQVQDLDILWPGWNTQEPEVATTINREVTWALHSVDGPGELILFVNEAFGQPNVLFDSTDAYPQAVGIETYTHAHGNWTFTEPGVYLLGIEMRAVTVDGEEVSDTALVQFAVGDEADPDDAFDAGEAAGPVDVAGEVEVAAPASDSDGEDGNDVDSGAGGEGVASPEESSSGSGSALPWLVAGAAALVVGGGAAVALARRRKASGASSVGISGEAEGSGETEDSGDEDGSSSGASGTDGSGEAEGSGDEDES